jgi:hypothetical protein
MKHQSKRAIENPDYLSYAGQQCLFGQNLLSKGEGEIHTGDIIEIKKEAYKVIDSER